MERSDNHVYLALVLAATAAIFSAAPPGDLFLKAQLLLQAGAAPQAAVEAGAIGNHSNWEMTSP
jgi:hypothetical protein